MRKSKKLLLILLFLTWVLYLVKANQLVLSLNPQITAVEEIKSDLSEYRNLEVYLDYSINFYDDLFKQISVKGWAFCPTVNENSEKKIALILRSLNKTYYIPAEIYNRIDVKSTFGDLTQYDNHGFDIRFSSVDIKNDIYDFYLYDHENSTDYGIKYLVTYKKEGDDFFLQDQKSTTNK